MLVADHHAFIGQTSFQAEARSQRQLAYPSFIELVRHTACVGEYDAMVAQQNHAEKEVKAYQETPGAEWLHFEQGDRDEENKAMVNERDNEQNYN
jgi:hypothetical protein